MKAAVLALAVLLVLAHPDSAAAVVVAVELAACAVLGWLIQRAVRRYPYRRIA